jgi:hypothetical protein
MKMKTRISFIVTLISFTAFVFAQHPAPMTVPEPVKESLAEDYPDALHTQWMIGNDQYKVLFIENGIQRSVRYTKKGKLIEMEEKIEISDLPKEVTSVINDNFVGYTAWESERVILANTDVLYNVDLIRDNEVLEIRVSPAGKILGKTRKFTRSDWESEGNE